jgi:hypothetical protein
MTKILIGAPIYDRAWILPEWIKAIEKQNFPKEDLGFLFNLGPDDDSTHEILWNWHERRPEFQVFDAQIQMKINHSAHPDETRIWSSMQYYNMVFLRNDLLERAAVLSDNFDYYFSLDSDILLEDPETLNKLVSYAQEDITRSVISPLMYMTPFDTNFPSAMSWLDKPGGKATRMLNKYSVGRLFEADIIMAAVFMQNYVFKNIRYQWHHQGEDLGFATALADAGYKSYAAWDLYCPHIMHKKMLTDYINTGVDPRKNLLSI